MENQLEKLSAKGIVDVKFWEEKQNQLVAENPFIEITDTASYTLAKANRTALLKGKTSLIGANGQEGVIKSKFKSLIADSVVFLNKLVDITNPHYEKQQAEVKRYEAILEEKRNEKKRLAKEKEIAEQKRKEEIFDQINSIEQEWSTKINEMTLITSIEIGKSLSTLEEDTDTTKFKEFSSGFTLVPMRLQEKFDLRLKTLKEDEERRLESERLELERKKFEEEKRIAREKEEKEAEKKRLEQEEIDAKNKAKADELAKIKAELQAEKDRIAKEETERIQKEIVEKQKKEAEEIAKAKEVRAKILEPLKPIAIQFIDSAKPMAELDGDMDEAIKDIVTLFNKELNEIKEHFIKQIENL